MSTFHANACATIGVRARECGVRAGEQARTLRRVRCARLPRVLACLLLAGLAVPTGFIAACKTGPDASQEPVVNAPLATPAQIRAAYNQRTDQLQRVWARCVGTLITKDREGNKRTEQGEGHFQALQPDRFALSLGKLGEVIVWLGCDDERYWVFMRTDPAECFVGRHDLLTNQKMRQLGTPAVPLDLFLLSGLAPLPDDPRARVSWSRDGRSIIYDTTLNGRALRYTLVPDSLLPTRIEFPSSFAGRTADDVDQATPDLYADLSRFARVPITGRLDGHPFIPTIIRVTHPASGTSLQVTLNDLSDGVKPRRLRDENFDFEALVRALNPDRVTDLDAGSLSEPSPTSTPPTDSPTLKAEGDNAATSALAEPAPDDADASDDEPTPSTISEERDG